jgi:hypothetical protein
LPPKIALQSQATTIRTMGAESIDVGSMLQHPKHVGNVSRAHKPPYVLLEPHDPTPGLSCCIPSDVFVSMAIPDHIVVS